MILITHNFMEHKIQFLGICSLVFSETQHVVRGPCVVVRDRGGFFRKNIFAQKMPKMGKK